MTMSLDLDLYRDVLAPSYTLGVGTVHVRYFQPERTGEFCLEFVAQKRDSAPKEIQL